MKTASIYELKTFILIRKNKSYSSFVKLTEIENLPIDNLELKKESDENSQLNIVDEVIQDFSPEIGKIYHLREEESEELQVKTGQLHENRILGLFLRFIFEGKTRVQTSEVEQGYKMFFKNIARSTVSTYLNVLKNESTLYKEREGRIVYYILHKDPPIRIKPFWFTRIFCVVPAYMGRAIKFSNLYINAEKYVKQYINGYDSENREILIRNFQFITGLIILKIFENRSSKCLFCQFSKKNIYRKGIELIKTAIKERSDFLEKALKEDLIGKHSELPTFDGTNIQGEINEENIVKEIIKNAATYKKDIDFQIMVSLRKQHLLAKQKTELEENTNNKYDLYQTGKI